MLVSLLKKLSNGLKNLSSDDQKMILLIMQSFCTGIFLSNFFTFSNGMFLKEFDSSYLPYAYILSGVIGVLISKLYSIVQKKAGSGRLFLSTLVFLTVISVTIWLCYLFFGENETARKTLVFAAFILISSFYTLVGLQFWGITFNLFNIRTSKKVFGKIGAGDVIASLLGYLLVFLYYQFSDPIGTMLLVGCISLSGGLVLQQVIIRKYFVEGTKKKPTTTGPSSEPIHKNKYVLLIFGMMVISVFTQYLVDYNFLDSTREVASKGSLSTILPGEDKIPLFIAQFFAFVKLVELIFRVSSGRFFKIFGINKVLLILPSSFVLVYLTVAVIYLFGQGDVIVYVFLLVLVSKLSERSVKRGLDEPAYKLLYQPMRPEAKLRAQTFVDGYAKQLAIAISGAFLLLLNVIGGEKSVISLIIAILILAVSLTWILIATNAFKVYTDKLRDFLKLGSSTKAAVEPDEDPEINEISNETIQSEYLDKLTSHERYVITEQLSGAQTPPNELKQIITSWYAKETRTIARLKILEIAFQVRFKEFLLRNLPNSISNKRITKTILRYLLKSNFRYDEENHNLYFDRLLTKSFHDIVWLKYLLSDLSNGDEKYEPLAEEVTRELKEKFDILFAMIALKKGKQDISAIKHHLLDGVVQNDSLFALELIDVIFRNDASNETKEKLTAIFEGDIQVLKREFIVYQVNAHERLRELVYANSFEISAPTRRMAFQLLCEHYYRLYHNTIIGCLHHTDTYISDLAFEYTAKHDPDLYHLNAKRSTTQVQPTEPVVGAD